jgi:Ser/Thr protein kinase RdoA (MazF antagonist)
VSPNHRPPGPPARLAALLEARYGAAVAGLSPFYAEAQKAVYRVDRRDGPPWVLRLFGPDRPLERVRGDAAVLRWVARHGIPAERVVAPAGGGDVVEADGWGLLVTRFVAGGPADRSPATLRRLGEVLGRLHALPPPPAGAAGAPFLTRAAGATPANDLPFGHACLARVAGRVPPPDVARYEALRAALAATRDGAGLPHALSHNDCHLANALQTPGGRVVLIDWDGAGQWPRVAALGLLLYSCAVQAPGEAPLPPDLTRVDHVLAGYRRHQRLTPVELEHLPDAVRFRPAVVAARELAASVERGEPEAPTGWWRRYAAADAVAARARQILTDAPPAAPGAGQVGPPAGGSTEPGSAKKTTR